MKPLIPAAALGTAITALIVPMMLNAVSEAGAAIHTPPRPGPLLWSEQYDTEMGAFDHIAYNATLETSGTLTYDLFSRNGEFTIVVMPRSEGDHWLAFDEVREVSRAEDHKSGARSVNLPAGEYAVGLDCENWWQDCPYSLFLYARGATT